jgi:hypothetical protein
MKLFYSGLLFAILFLGCAKEQPQASWVILNPWELTENVDAQMDQGQMTGDVSQAFVNMDGKILGAFELPAKFPVIGEGEHNFVIIPGVITNGISSTKTRYPFMDQYEVTVNLIKGDTITMSPTTQYYADLSFLIEDFESPSIQFDYSTESDVQLTRENDPSILKWGGYYGSVVLNDADSLFSAVTTFGQPLPKQGSAVYLELDYMNSNSLLTGVVSYGSGTYHEDPNIQLNPQEDPIWKHIYIDMTEIISFRTGSPFADMNFIAILDELGTEKFIYLDNIKVIYR